MPIYQYFILLILLLLVVLMARYFFLRKEQVSVELYIKALKEENNGHFEEAVINYESALNEINKIRLHHELKHTIIEKLKILHRFIDYNNNFKFNKAD